MFSFTCLLVILNTQKFIPGYLAFIILKCVYIVCSILRAGTIPRSFVLITNNGMLKDSALKITHKNASSMHSLEQVITVATTNLKC